MDRQRNIAEAMRRAVDVFSMRPGMGLHEDATATVVWQGGSRMTAFHGSGASMDTDMPAGLGGSGDCVSPGWLFRAGIAACSATAIYMTAASAGIEVDDLEIQVDSESDTRGLLGMTDDSGGLVYPGPRELRMRIRISARYFDALQLRELVEEGLRRSPIQNAMLRDTPLSVQVEVGESQAG